VFNTHYRKELNLSEEALEASIHAVQRVGDFEERLADATGGTPEMAELAQSALAEFRNALFDDLNAPNALAVLFTFITRVNAQLDRRGTDQEGLERAREAFLDMNRVLDIVPDRQVDDVELVGWVEERLAARRQARSRRDFAEADRIRDEIVARGIAIEDGPGRTKWKRIR
jgi:cysteinyl-tRNA synthetase